MGPRTLAGHGTPEVRATGIGIAEAGVTRAGTAAGAGSPTGASTATGARPGGAAASRSRWPWR